MFGLCPAPYSLYRSFAREFAETGQLSNAIGDSRPCLRGLQQPHFLSQPPRKVPGVAPDELYPSCTVQPQVQMDPQRKHAVRFGSVIYHGRTRGSLSGHCIYCTSLFQCSHSTKLYIYQYVITILFRKTYTIKWLSNRYKS